MAANIKNNVTNINAGPKKRTSAKAKAALEAQRLKDDEGRGLKGAPVIEEDSLPASDRTVGLSDNGHAELTPGIFLRWVQKLNQHEAKGEELKLKLKEWRTERKLLRKEANGDRIVLAQMDEALEDLKTEQVDLLAREERRRFYHECLGIPLTVQTEANLPVDDVAQAKARWRRRGEQDGRLAKVRQVPEGCPPENIPDYLSGHDAGTTVFLQKSPLTRDGFDSAGNVKTPAAPTVVQGDSGQSLTLNEGHFQAGTDLEDANLRTLLPGHHEAFHNAVSVYAVFGSARRILKEVDPEAPGGVYVDDGVEAPVSEPEPTVPSASELA